VQVVSSGGWADFTQVGNGGAQYVFAGGSALVTTIESGGFLLVSSGGVASGSFVAGGVDVVSSGGLDISTVLGSGGMAFVTAAGTIEGATLRGGATLVVEAGGTLLDGLTISGGVAIVSAAVASGQSVTFGGSGDVIVQDAAGFAAAIGGFATGDTIDLAGFRGGSAATLTFVAASHPTGGTLDVAYGGAHVSLQLLGSYTSASFALAGDGFGGTLIRTT
jgi:autotransporter passenger strand-loop-strand repeat protein